MQDSSGQAGSRPGLHHHMACFHSVWDGAGRVGQVKSSKGAGAGGTPHTCPEGAERLATCQHQQLGKRGSPLARAGPTNCPLPQQGVRLCSSHRPSARGHLLVAARLGWGWSAAAST